MVDAALFEFDGVVADTHATRRSALVPTLCDPTLRSIDAPSAGGRTVQR